MLSAEAARPGRARVRSASAWSRRAVCDYGPAALLVINGSKDALFAPEGVHAAFEKLTACYRKAGIPEKVRLRLYDTPHEFNAEMQAEAWEWLRRWL